MHRLPLHLLLVVVLLLSSAPRADTGYKCVDAQGRIAFQDRPCPRDQQEASFRYDPARSPAVSLAPAGVLESAQAAAPTAVDPLPVVARAPVPPLFVCRRGDGGESYYSDSGATIPYTVPLGVLGYPSRSISDVYGGRDGVGVSAPEFSHPRLLPPGANSAIAGASVWVEDECRPLAAVEACRVRAKQLDGVRSKLRRAFKDERATLEPRERELTQQLAGC